MTCILAVLLLGAPSPAGVWEFDLRKAMEVSAQHGMHNKVSLTFVLSDPKQHTFSCNPFRSTGTYRLEGDGITFRFDRYNLVFEALTRPHAPRSGTPQPFHMRFSKDHKTLYWKPGNQGLSFVEFGPHDIVRGPGHPKSQPFYYVLHKIR